MVLFPLAPDQTIAQMWSNGARGGKENARYERLSYFVEISFVCMTNTNAA